MTWRCPCCGALNEVATSACRVCRTPEPGVIAATARPDLFGTVVGMGAALPAPLLLLGLAVAMDLWWQPLTAPFAISTTHSGWSAAAFVDRRQELSTALRELRGLQREIVAASTGTASLEGDWNDRLARVREKWQLYGEADRMPRLGDAEVALCNVVLELASIRYQLAQGADASSIAAHLDSAERQLATAEENLKNADPDHAP